MKRCPCCGAPYNGKRCRECYYEPFTEEIAHGLHTHEGEPLIIEQPEDRPVRRSVPTRQKECRQYSGRRKKDQPQVALADSDRNRVHGGAVRADGVHYRKK